MAASESVVVPFVHVVLVIEHAINGRNFLRNRFGVAFVCVPIGPPRHSPADHRRADREKHQEIFCPAGVLFLFRSSRQLPGFALGCEHMRLFGEHRLQKSFKTILPSKAVRPSQKSCEQAEESENDQRAGHRLGRFVDVVLCLVAHARPAMKRQKHQAKHVKRRHQGSDVANEPEIPIRALLRRPRLPQNFILREKPGERRDARDREGSDEHGPVRNRDAPVQITHVAHVLLAAHCMDHRA